MPDYDLPVGPQSARLRIRDTGTQVLFMINTYNSITYWGSVSYVWSVPGDTNNNSSFGYTAGAGWKTVRTVAATASGVYSWNIGDTGTTVVGNPPLHSVTINRATKPAAPTSKVPTAITHTGMTFDIDDGATGGSAITGREYQYSLTNAFTGAAAIALPANGTVTRTDLEPGLEYFWRGRVKNAVGTSDWSTTRSAKTLPPVWVKISGVWKKAIPYVKVAGVWKPAVAYVKKDGVWVITNG